MTRSRDGLRPASRQLGKDEAEGAGSPARRSFDPGGEGPADAKLVELALDGNEKACEALFERYRQRVYRVAYGWCREQQTALDLVQDVFVKAFGALDRFRKESSLWTWLCRITINRCLDYVRKKERTKEVPVESPGDMAPAASLEDDPSDGLELEELKGALAGAIEALSPEAKSAFVLRFYDQMTYRDIAKSLECSVGTVMSRLFYARQKLREMLADYL